MEIPKDFSAEARQRREAELEKRAAQVEQLEATLARQVSGLGRARRALSVTLAEVQGALASDQVLIELLRYRHYMGKNKWEPRYGALVIASRDEPKWIPLGAANEIEKKHRALSANPFVATRTNQRCAWCFEVCTISIWLPIEKASSRGGQDNHPQSGRRTQFRFLRDIANPNDEFLIEKYSIRYVASGRDLLREREASATELLVVFGNPDFGRGRIESFNKRDRSRCDARE